MDFFDSIHGNDKQKNFFRSRIEEGKLSHAYILEAPQGGGKKMFALCIAATLASLEKTSPKERDEKCRRILEGLSPDVRILSRSDDGKKTIGVSAVRDFMASVYLAPSELGFKMYLFDESILSIGSANCTNAGFGINKKSNLEVMIDKIPSNQELSIVSEIISKSIRVDDSLYDQVNQWLINQPKQDFKPIQGYLLLEDGMSVESLPGSDTPMSMWKSSTNEPDDKSDKLASIDWTRFGLCSEDSYEDFLESMKLKFDNIPVVQNFLQFIDESDNGRRFGECKSWVRDHYCGTNYDYCLEITQMLYSWIPELYSQYRVWRPHYTQIIYNINRHKI